MREKRILAELVHSEQYCRLEDLAQQFQVSTRTISNDLKYLMQDGAHHGFALHLKRKAGYYVEILDADKLRQYLVDEETMWALKGKERMDTIIAILLGQKDYLTQESIADLLQVSKSIIKVDMAKVEKALFEHSITLIKKAHYGMRVEAKGMHRKLYLLELLEKENLYLKQRMREVLDETGMQQLEKELMVLLRSYELDTNYIELKKIDVFLRASILLAYAHIQEEVQTEEDGVHHQLAVQLAKKVQAVLGVALSSGDVADIAQYLRSKTKPKTIEHMDEQLKQDIEAFLKEADDQYQTQFNQDEEFKKSLLSHVSLLLDRLHQSISFSNPLVHEISVKYPLIFNICIRFATMLEKRYQVTMTQDEIGFIATHFAVHMEKELHHKLDAFHRIAIICSSGGGSAFLIKLKLESIFVSSTIQTFSLLEMEEVRAFAPDIIFTIKQLDEAFDVPIIEIRELLDDVDIQNIKNMLEGSAWPSFQETTFASLFRKSAFHIFEHGSYHDMVECMAAQMEKDKLCEEGYQQLVAQREAVLSTVYHHGIAIPHPLEMCGTTNILSVGIVKHEVRDENKPVHVIFLVNLMKGDLKLHQNITRVLFDVMSDPALIAHIRKALSYEDFMKSIAHLKF